MLVSTNLTVGTPEANGEFANSFSAARFVAIPDDPGTPADEADVRIGMSVSDVRRAPTLADYAGELESVTTLRVTDRASGTSEATTMLDTPFRAKLNCAATAAADRGGTCSVVTTVEALLPGALQDGMRSIWELGAIEVHDGGGDGDADTRADNRPFLHQGLFVP